MLPPRCTETGPLFVMVTSAVGRIVDPQESEEAVVKAMVKVRLCAGCKVKLLHSTLVPPPLRTQPGVEAPASKVSPVGIRSVITTFWAAVGPAFVTVTVYAIASPRSTELGPVFTIERSAFGAAGHCTGVVTVVLVLLPAFGSPCEEETVA